MALDRSWRRISWLILGIGGLILAGGLALGWGSLRHVLYAERTEGEVIEIRREGDMYAPVLRFRLASGETQEVKDLGSGAPDFAVGDRVTVLYMPTDPEDFRIDTFDRLWFSAIFVTVFAGFWLLFGAVAWALSSNVDMFIIGERAFLIAARRGFDGFRHECRWRSTCPPRLHAGFDASSRAYERLTRPDGSSAVLMISPRLHALSQAFTTSDGREIEFHGRGGSDRGLTRDDRVTVVYDPANPIRASIVSFLDLWLPSAVAFGVAILFGGSVWLSRWSRRRAS